jgi:hypothetical protein
MHRVQSAVLQKVDQVMPDTVRQQRSSRRRVHSRDSGLVVSSRGDSSPSSQPSTWNNTSDGSQGRPPRRGREQVHRSDHHEVIRYPAYAPEPVRPSRPAPRPARAHTIRGPRYRDNGQRTWTEHGEWPQRVTSPPSEHDGSENTESTSGEEAQDVEASSPPVNELVPEGNERPQGSDATTSPDGDTGGPSNTKYRPMAPFTMEDWHAFDERHRRRLRRNPDDRDSE